MWNDQTRQIHWDTLKWSEVKWKSLSRVQLFTTPWTIQSMGFSRPEYWSGYPFPFSRVSSQLRDWTQVSHIAGRFFTSWVIREATILMGNFVEYLSQLVIIHIHSDSSKIEPLYKTSNCIIIVCCVIIWNMVLLDKTLFKVHKSSSEFELNSSILTWRIPWTIQSMGLQRVGHEWATFTFTFMGIEP